MKAIDLIATETEKLGYKKDAIRRDYSYSDVWSSSASTRSVPFAAFTQTPPSYRSAAFAVIEMSEDKAATTVREHRALGAPLFFVIEEDGISVWQVYAHREPRSIGRLSLSRLPEYFEAHRDEWAPDAIHRAKSIGRIDASYQLSFVDVGLIPAIEGEIHTRLDHLIREAITGTREGVREEAIRIFFRGVFRLLAAKILMDRKHPEALAWDGDDVLSVLSAIGHYYDLEGTRQAWPREAISELEPVWSKLRSGLNVANISADDLAYVYESTLVTDKARADFGTHSTPRHIADYIVERLRLWEFGEAPPRIYEPFAGAGVFLGSALRHVRDGLPQAWTDAQRHELLVNRISGAEIDPFAAEAAKLSLILADYPSKNGWLIEEADLFRKGALATRLSEVDVVLCNPPFQSFKPEEREVYPEAASISRSKAVFALETALQCRPKMLGFVVPNTLLVDRRFVEQRRQIERGYSEIEMVALPDRIFNVSQANTALLIARGRSTSSRTQLVRSATVVDRDKSRFELTGQPSHVRETTRRAPISREGSIWIFPSQEIWDALALRPKLGHFLEGHWGVRWKSGQAGRAHSAPGPGRARGFKSTADIHQFVLSPPHWLDVDPQELLAGGDLDWEAAKILCNATRVSRGYWRLAAAVDRQGRWANQQFMGFWPKRPESNIDLDAFAAIINGPVVNAFVTERSFDARFRIEVVEDAPIPASLPPELGDLSREYAKLAKAGTTYVSLLDELLEVIDERVFKAYGLTDAQKADLKSKIGDDERPLLGRSPKRRSVRGRTQKHAGNTSDITLPFETSRVVVGEGGGLGEEITVAEGARRLSAYAKVVPLHDWAGEVVSERDFHTRFPAAGMNAVSPAPDLVVLIDRSGNPAVPTEQISNGVPAKGLGEILQIVGDPNVAWMWLRQPHGLFEARSPLEILKSGKLRDVMLAALRDFR